MMNKLLFAIVLSISIPLIVGSAQLAYAAPVESVSSGDWNVGGTWDSGIPNPADDITIKNGHTVTVTDVRTVTGSLTIEVGAHLIIDGTAASAVRLTIDGGTLTNLGQITINGGSTEDTAGSLDIRNNGVSTNSGSIIANGGTADNTGRLANLFGSSFTTTGSMTFNGGIGDDSGSLFNFDDSTFTNEGTMIFFGGEGTNSGRIANTELDATIINECSGTMTFNGGIGNNSGRFSLFTNAVGINNGVITLLGGIGDASGTLFISGGSIVTNHNTIIENPGPGSLSGIIRVLAGSTFVEDPIPCRVIGGSILEIDTTSLLLAGIQSSAIWMLPVLAGAAGAGFAAFKLRRK